VRAAAILGWRELQLVDQALEDGLFLLELLAKLWGLGVMHLGAGALIFAIEDSKKKVPFSIQ
jgi:hypothetical protein